MALLDELFGGGAQVDPRALDTDPSDLLRRALRLNHGVPVAPAMQQMAPPLDPVREVRDYPVTSVPQTQGVQMPSAADATVPVGTTQPQPQQAAQSAEPTFGERLGKFLIAGGPGSIANGIGQAFYGADREKQTENLTMRLLQEKGGFTQEQALAAVRNPAIMQQILPQVFGPKPGNTKLGAGERLIGPKGETIATNDVPKPGFHTIGEGQALTDDKGNVLFKNGEKDKLPDGYEWIDKNDHSKGVAALPGGPATKSAGESASKLALMNVARNLIKDTRAKLENDWGPIGALQNSVSNLLPGVAGDIGVAQQNVRLGIEGALRLMTGAAATETEVTRYSQLFMPNARDSKETAKAKIDKLMSFMDEAERFSRQGHLTRDEQARQLPRPGGAGAADPLGIR